MADIVKLSSHEHTKPVLGGFVKTEVALDIQRTLTMLHASGGGQMALVVGQPGSGKTQAIRDFKFSTPGTAIYAVTAGECLPPFIGDQRRAIATARRHWDCCRRPEDF